jgi:hypothetical protein
MLGVPPGSVLSLVPGSGEMHDERVRLQLRDDTFSWTPCLPTLGTAGADLHDGRVRPQSMTNKLMLDLYGERKGEH